MILNYENLVIKKKYLSDDRLEEYNTYIFPKCWVFSKIGSVINQGIAETNSIQIRVPNEYVVVKVEVGDIVVLNGNEYTIKTVIENNVGNNPHLHLEA